MKREELKKAVIDELQPFAFEIEKGETADAGAQGFGGELLAGAAIVLIYWGAKEVLGGYLGEKGKQLASTTQLDELEKRLDEMEQLVSELGKQPRMIVREDTVVMALKHIGVPEKKAVQAAPRLRDALQHYFDGLGS